MMGGDGWQVPLKLAGPSDLLCLMPWAWVPGKALVLQGEGLVGMPRPDSGWQESSWTWNSGREEQDPLWVRGTQ